MKFKPKKNNTFFRNLPPTTYHLQPSRGFTLAELLVTISLFVILTTVTLFSSSKFNGSILLSNLAYDVAITIRQAQTFGVNVREVASGGGEFQKAYGVHFDTADSKKFILFADTYPVLAGDGMYTVGSDTVVDTYNIKRGNKISGLCVTPKSATDTTEDCGITSLDIVFKRPNPDAVINGDSSKTTAKIKISSTDGNTRNIVVNSTGQISVGN